MNVILKDFSLRHRAQTASGAHPIATGAFSLGMNSPVSALTTRFQGAKVQNTWTCNSNPPYIFMVWCLIKRWDSFALPLLSFPYTLALPRYRRIC
jgi:hypothetical protein